MTRPGLEPEVQRADQLQTASPEDQYPTSIASNPIPSRGQRNLGTGGALPSSPSPVLPKKKLDKRRVSSVPLTSSH